MISERCVDSFFEALIAGDRAKARLIVAEARKLGNSPDDMIAGLFWPTYNTIDRLHRSHQLACLNHHMAVRLLRVLVDQNAAHLNCNQSRGKTIFAVCGPSESEELAAQMALDVLEGAGFRVTFAGSRIANDDVLARVSDEKPDILLIFAAAAEDLPSVRALIDTVREIGSCPNMQIALGGGVFNRAEGLAEEIGADIWATTPLELSEALINEPTRRAIDSQRTVGRARKRRAA